MFGETNKFRLIFRWKKNRYFLKVSGDSDANQDIIMQCDILLVGRSPLRIFELRIFSHKQFNRENISYLELRLKLNSERERERERLKECFCRCSEKETECERQSKVLLISCLDRWYTRYYGWYLLQTTFRTTKLYTCMSVQKFTTRTCRLYLLVSLMYWRVYLLPFRHLQIWIQCQLCRSPPRLAGSTPQLLKRILMRKINL